MVLAVARALHLREGISIQFAVFATEARTRYQAQRRWASSQVLTREREPPASHLQASKLLQ